MEYKVTQNIDLKELENYGFEYEEEDGESWWGKYIENDSNKIFVSCKDRIIRQGKFQLIYGYTPVELDINLIQDLLNNGLVECTQDDLNDSIEG